MKGGALCTKFALAGLGLSTFSSFCKKKWTDQCEVRHLKKKVTVRVEYFSLKGKAPTKNTNADQTESCRYSRTTAD